LISDDANAISEKFSSYYIGSWATTSSLNYTKANLKGTGTVDSALAIGGYTGSI